MPHYLQLSGWILCKEEVGAQCPGSRAKPPFTVRHGTLFSEVSRHLPVRSGMRDDKEPTHLKLPIRETHKGIAKLHLFRDTKHRPIWTTKERRASASRHNCRRLDQYINVCVRSSAFDQVTLSRWFGFLVWRFEPLVLVEGQRETSNLQTSQPGKPAGDVEHRDGRLNAP